ncbi:hypothetical protein BCR36DRAFT_352206 [Piromyces finnis]|uniref:DNA-directed RNA polymerase III subunit RPC5 n=1 Tax=Piromyces finnis TaxID=1754191 RepID=A0A1Y1VA06_9FUNG|nr:hypothetical protein BCR36DRAFT_352206 [Piromyces finnis]|eukprot:ORX50791.1 hypothetical protein BCR36DRAFT_352206 [Piromyces finnis]
MESEDEIVQQIDIFLSNPKNPHYLLQYPIRTQPFNEFNMPVEGRIKPNAQQLELDLTINTGAVTYDRQKADELSRGLVEESSIGPGRKLIKKAETLEKQTLSSSLLPKNGNYMFGVVKNDGLHISPISALLQLRPNFKYLDNIDKIEKLKSSKENEDEQEPVSRLVQMQVKKTEATTLQDEILIQQRIAEEEPWSLLQIYMPETEQSKSNNGIQTEVKEEIEFNKSTEDYLDRIHPYVSTTENIEKTYSYSQGLPLNDIHTLPLGPQLRSLIFNSFIMTYDNIKSLIKTNVTKDEIIIKELEKYAILIKGNWVLKSEISYKDYSYHARQYLLSLFKTKDYVNRKEFIEFTHIYPQMSYEMFSEIATCDRGKDSKGWQLKFPRNKAFEKKFPEVVSRQEEAFNKELAMSMKILTKANSLPSKSKIKNNDTMEVDTVEEDEDVKIVKLSDDLLPTQHYMIKGQTVDEQLDNLIYQLFKNYGVLKLTYIMSLINIRQRSTFSSNKIRDNVTQAMIRAKLNKYCISIRKNVYVLKTSGDEQVDLYRQLLINYFEKNQSIQKSILNKLVTAAQLSKIPTTIYSKILKELATSHGSTWTLKSGIPEEVLE